MNRNYGLNKVVELKLIDLDYDENVLFPNVRLYIDKHSGNWIFIGKKYWNLVNILKKGILSDNKIAKRWENYWKKLYKSGFLKINGQLIKPDKRVSPKDSEDELALLILFFSKSCNLACKYCFANAPQNNVQKNKYLLNIDYARKAVDVMINSTNNNIAIEFNSGEPFLHPDFIENIVKYTKLNYPNDFTNRIKFIVQTNATLINDDIVKLIKKYNIGIGVSLDGNKEINDKNRIFPNGQGTFDYIIKGINYLKKNNVKFGILSVMTSPKDFNESFKFFVENNYNHIKFNILFKQGRQKETIDDEQQEAFAEAHYNIFKQALKIYKETGRKIKLANISNMLKNIIFFDRPYMCMRSPCGAGSSQLTVDWAGNIYPCEDFLGMDNFILGNIEHINDFKKLKYSSIMEPIKSRTPDKIHECKDCIWQQFCGGGCPLSSYTKYNSFQRKSDLCSYYKTLYKKLFWEIYSNGEMVYKYLFLDKHIKTEE